MKVAYFIAQRIAFSSQRSFTRFIVRLATAATALSVAAMIITLSFVTGFQEAVANKVFSFWGHIRVQQYEQQKSLVSEERPLEKNDTVLQVLKNDPAVKQVQCYATKSGVVEKNKNIEGVLLKGVESNYAFTNLQSFLVKGRWLKFNDTAYSREIVLSQLIADKLEAKVGDFVHIYFINAAKGKASFRKVNVCGIYKTGIEDYDNKFALCDIRLLQRVSGWNKNEIGGYEIFLKDYTLMDTTSSLLYNELPGAWVSTTIRQEYPNIFDWLNIQDVNKVVIFIVMSIVAVINLITCLLILVLERTKMVGILKAVGSSNKTIREIFLYYATIIAGRGIIIGFIFGAGICLLQQYTGFIKLDETNYYVSVAPVHIIWWQVALICISALVVCFIALMLPVLFIKNIKPVKAIRFR